MDVFNHFLVRLNINLTFLWLLWLILYCEVLYHYLLFSDLHMLIRILAATITPLIHAV